MDFNSWMCQNKLLMDILNSIIEIPLLFLYFSKCDSIFFTRAYPANFIMLIKTLDSSSYSHHHFFPFVRNIQFLLSQNQMSGTNTAYFTLNPVLLYDPSSDTLYKISFFVVFFFPIIIIFQLIFQNLSKYQVSLNFWCHLLPL